METPDEPVQFEPVPVALDYQRPISRLSERPIAFTDGLWPTGIAAGGGVSILLLFAVTRLSILPFFGLLWLAIGGVLTFIGLVIGVSYVIDAVHRGEASVGRIAVALLAPIANLAVAYGCVAAGAWLGAV